MTTPTAPAPQRGRHTPTPWKACGAYVYAGKDCISICETDNAIPDIYEANAALIVRAVNAHEAILAVLKAVEWVVFDSKDSGEPDCCPMCWNAQIVGHQDDCPLAAALAAGAGENG